MKESKNGQVLLFDRDKIKKVLEKRRLREDDRRLLVDVKRQMNARLDQGTVCPCCDRFIRRSKKCFSFEMGRVLMEITRIYFLTDDWVDIRNINDVRSGDYALARHWGLIEGCKEKNKKGFWKPTKKGIAFVFYEGSIPNKINLLKNKLEKINGDEVNIIDVVGDEYYAKKMKGMIEIRDWRKR